MGNRIANAVGGVVGTVGAGLVSFMTGLFDPTWLVANLEIWFPTLTGFARFLGPEIYPGVPWSTLVPAIVAVAILVRLYKWQSSKDGAG
jgi:hypothetical protein